MWCDWSVKTVCIGWGNLPVKIILVNLPVNLPIFGKKRLPLDLKIPKNGFSRSLTASMMLFFLMKKKLENNENFRGKNITFRKNKKFLR